MDSCKNLPAVRFADFNDPWEEKRLGEVAETRIAPKKLKTEEYLKTGLYPIIDQGENYIAGYTNQADAILPASEYVLFGDHTREIKYVDFAFAQGADGLKILQANAMVKPKFLLYFISSLDIPDNGYSRHWKFIQNTLIPLPPLAEQRKIGEFFGGLDNLIDLWRGKLEKLKNIKKALLEKMLPSQGSDLPAVRFADFSDPWEEKRLGEVAEINPRNEIKDDTDVSFIPMALIEDGYSNLHSSTVRKWGDVKSGFTHFAEGDIGIAKITPCFENRKSVIFKNLKNKFGAGTTELHIVRPLKNAVVAGYLLYFFKSERFIADGIKTYTGTAGQQRIGRDFIQNYLIPLPPLAEQRKIGEFFGGLDNLIDLWRGKLEKLKNIKKALLEKMLPN